MIWEPSEQVYSHSVGVCRALPLGSIAGNGYTLGKYDNDAAEHDRPPKGAYSQSRSLRCTDLKGRHLTAPVRLDSRIGCRPEWPYTRSEDP